MKLSSFFMSAIIFRPLISLTISEGLDICLIDVMTTQLCRLLDNYIYMKVPEGFKMPKVYP